MSERPPSPERLHDFGAEPPDLPEEQTIERLRTTFRLRPRIKRAWLSGERVARGQDGGDSYKVTVCAVLLDPPLSATSRSGTLRDFNELVDDLDAETAYSREPDRGWIIVNERHVARSPEHFIEIYARAEGPD